MSISQPRPAVMFSHSPDQHQRNCHGSGQVPERHGSFPGTIAGVLRLLKSVGGRSRCGSTRSLGWGLTANRPAHRAMQRSAGFESLRISCPSIYHSPTFRRGRRTSSLPRFGQILFHLFGTISCKRCIHTNRCKLRHSVTTRFHIAHTLLACPAPCCQ